MSDLTLRDFPAYFRAVHGTTPFPWQGRLLRSVHEEGRWPDSLALPTGCGKTAALDVALFNLALQAGRKGRTAPLRIAMVVDRRTIVDQAFRRAERIRLALQDASDGVVARVRDRLSGLSRSGTPLRVTALRGGIARDDSWAHYPDQPQILVSTVDQVGSRLLFRGYGVSDSMKPVHAGLLGNDLLLLLDEVHLSQAFAETLSTLQSTYMGWREVELPTRWQYVPMSATPRPDRKPVFELDEDDEQHPLIAKRLGARKPVELVEAKASRSEWEPDKDVIAKCAERVAGFVAPGRAIAAVVNRVRTARELFIQLRRDLDGKADVDLLTGRMRPIDREAIEIKLTPRIAAGRNRDPSARPVVVVATQCIEAGADYDFDAMVTECASLDALRQRFGRLNRLGDTPECRGVIVGRADASKSEDPVYGAALGETWKYLKELGNVDFGIRALKLPKRERLEAMLPPLADIPVLLPSHLEAWVQTSPRPEPDPDVAPWLHGVGRGAPDVQIVWRADLSQEELRDATMDRVLARLDLCPPTSPEALSVPIWTAKQWLSQQRTKDEGSDAEGERPVEEDERAPDALPRYAVRWRGEDSTRVTRARDIRPGDTLVVPASYGGVTAGSFDPLATDAVDDLGDQAFARQKGRAILRLHPAITQLYGWGTSPPEPNDEITADEARKLIAEWLQQTSGGPPHAVKARDTLLAEIGSKRRPPAEPFDSVNGRGYFGIVARRRWPTGAEVTTEDDTASFTGVEVPLREHLAGVAEFARDFAARCDLPEDAQDALELAGAWHDAGKADPRFQIWLHGGSRFKATVARDLLAKSGTASTDRESRRLARERSGYPKGARHEVTSVALMEGCDGLRASAGEQWGLVLHLVASHHGYCRPLAPFIPDEAPVTVDFASRKMRSQTSSATGLERLDSGVCDRFWRMNRKYGWFGLAWLEAILRLADHRRSEHEQRGEG